MSTDTHQQKDENDNKNESLPPNSMNETITPAAVTTTIIQPNNDGNRRRTSSLGLPSSARVGQGNGAGGDVSSSSLSSSIRLKKSDSFQLNKTESYKLAKKRNREQHHNQQNHSQNQQIHSNTTNAQSAAIIRPPAQLAYVRDVDSAKPMGWDDRFMLSVRRKLGMDDNVGRVSWDGNIDGEENSDGSYVLPGMIGHDNDTKIVTTDSNERKKKNVNMDSPRHRKKESMPNINLANDTNLRKQLQLHRRNKSMSVIMIEDTKNSTNSDSGIHFKEDEELGHECANSIQLYQQLQRNHRKKQSLTTITSVNADDNDYSSSNNNNIDDEIGRRTGDNSSSSMFAQPFTQMKLHRKKQSLTQIGATGAEHDSYNSRNDRHNDSSHKEEEEEMIFGHSSTSSNLDEFPRISITTKVLVPAANATESDSIDHKSNNNLDSSRILETISRSSSRGDSNNNHTKQALHDCDEVGCSDENNSISGTAGIFVGKDNDGRDIKSRRISNRQHQHESPTIRDNMTMQQPQSTIGILVDKLLQRQTSTSNSNRSMLSKKKNDGDYDNADENNKSKADSLYFATLVDANDDRAERRNTNSTTTAAVVFPNKLNQNDMNTMRPAGVLRRFFHWTFRVYFGILFFLMALCFFIIVIMFAIAFMILLHFEPDCLSIIGKYPYGHTGAFFSDAFYLSWTTFSTVGYGTAAVALTYQNDSPNNCAFVTIVASLEALSGTLFTGVCGAILFGKVLRILSHAQVVFSDPILIRYGAGAREVSNEDDDEGEDENNKYEQLPFPVLEFRIINRLNDEDGGEIVDASVQVVAKIDHEDKVYENDLFNDCHDDCNNFSNTEESDRLDRDINRIEEMNARNETSQTPLTNRNVVHIGRFWYDRMRDSKNVASSDSIVQSTISNRNLAGMGNSLPPNQSSYSHDIEKRRASFSLPLSPFSRATAQPSASFLSAGTTSNGSMNRSARNLIRSTITANSTARQNTSATTAGQQQHPKTMSHQQYYKLNVETPEHPFFKRVWIVRHVLDNTSPIVKQRVKSKIKGNNGYWPYKELNTYTDIIKSLQFNHIIVSLNGVSNISASTVYAQKIYDFEDVKVGYQFANVLYRDHETHKLKVDLDLINDVRVQRGGGNEPLWVEEESDDDDDEEEELDIVDKCEIRIGDGKVKELDNTTGNAKRIDNSDTV